MKKLVSDKMVQSQFIIYVANTIFCLFMKVAKNNMFSTEITFQLRTDFY